MCPECFVAGSSETSMTPLRTATGAAEKYVGISRHLEPRPTSKAGRHYFQKVETCGGERTTGAERLAAGMIQALVISRLERLGRCLGKHLPSGRG